MAIYHITSPLMKYSVDLVMHLYSWVVLLVFFFVVFSAFAKSSSLSLDSVFLFCFFVGFLTGRFFAAVVLLVFLGLPFFFSGSLSSPLKQINYTSFHEKIIPPFLIYMYKGIFEKRIYVQVRINMQDGISKSTF